jgi:hypothetical protein
MKKISTFLTLALVALVAFVSCAEPKYSDKMIDVKPIDVVFDMDESDGTWTVKKGYGDNADVSIDEGVLTIKAKAGYTQDVVKLDNPGATKVVIEYSSTGKVTFGFLTKTADPWGGRIADKDQYFDPTEEDGKKVTLDIPEDAGMLAICSNGDATNVITVKKVTIK